MLQDLLSPQAYRQMRAARLLEHVKQQQAENDPILPLIQAGEICWLAAVQEWGADVMRDLFEQAGVKYL